MTVGSLALGGSVGIAVKGGPVTVGLSDRREMLAMWNPRSDLGQYVKRCLKYLPTDIAADLIDKVRSALVVESSLSVVVFRRDDYGLFVPEDYGEVSHKVITTAGVGFLVDAWQNIVELENMKYHGIGTGTTAEAVGDTALVTESTTALNPDSTRATGSLGEGASGSIFRTVGTLTADAAIAATEHGLFNQAATGGGVMWDRSVFLVNNIGIGESIQFTYDMTATAGG